MWDLYAVSLIFLTLISIAGRCQRCRRFIGRTSLDRSGPLSHMVVVFFFLSLWEPEARTKMRPVSPFPELTLQPLAYKRPSSISCTASLPRPVALGRCSGGGGGEGFYFGRDLRVEKSDYFPGTMTRGGRKGRKRRDGK